MIACMCVFDFCIFYHFTIISPKSIHKALPSLLCLHVVQDDILFMFSFIAARVQLRFILLEELPVCLGCSELQYLFFFFL